MTKASLASRVATLERRLAALEQGAAPESTTGRPTDSVLGLLDALVARGGARFSQGDARGAVGYAGVARFGEREYRWAREHGLAELLDADWSSAATILECLGSPVRLALLRALIRGPQDRQALQATLGEATSGQLYHHLRDLQAARLLVQRARGTYELAAHAIVPVLAILALALELATTQESEPRRRGTR